jgi:hypothetical protein
MRAGLATTVVGQALRTEISFGRIRSRGITQDIRKAAVGTAILV